MFERKNEVIIQMSESSAARRTRPVALQRTVSSAVVSSFLEDGGEDRLAEALQQPDTNPGRQAAEREGATISVLSPRPVETPAAAPVSPAPVAAAPAVVAPVLAAPAPTVQVHQPEEAAPRVEQAYVAPQPAIAPQVAAVTHSQPLVDAASISIPEDNTKRNKHRRYGNRGKDNQAVDMTMSLDPAHAARLTELAGHEMLRTKTRVSISEVVRHLLDYAMSNVKDNKVIPTEDGCGLHSRTNEA
jgi:hypothetical protein